MLYLHTPTRIFSVLARLCIIIAVFALAACGASNDNTNPVENTLQPTPTPVEPTTKSYTVGGDVAGLAAGASVGLSLATGAGPSQALTVTFPAHVFAFDTAVASGSTYTLTITAHPSGQQCQFANHADSITGNVGLAAVSEAIACSSEPTYSVGGSIVGLDMAAAGLKLTLTEINSTTLIETLSIAPGSSAFTFNAGLFSGGSYKVAVSASPRAPISQTCAVDASTASVVIATANITNVAIQCTTNRFTVGGKVDGLATGASVNVSLSTVTAAPQAVTVTASANTYLFNPDLASGSTYTLTVSPNPANQLCTFSNGSNTLTGTITDAAVNAVVTCANNPNYTISGTVTGLAQVTGTTLVLANRSSATTFVTIREDGRFSFAEVFADGTPYQVSVNAQPSNPPQECVIDPANSSGDSTTTQDANLIITCRNAYALSVDIVGLASGSGVELSLTTAAGYSETMKVYTPTFNFGSTVGTAYTLNIKTQPVGQTCSFANNTHTTTGTVDAAVRVIITCITKVVMYPRFAYVANSDSTVSGYSVDAVSGQLRHNGYALTKAGSNTVVVDPSGKFAYVSNFATGDVSAFSIDVNTGALASIGAPVPVGMGPRSMSIDPAGKFLYVLYNTAVDRDTVATFRIESNGALAFSSNFTFLSAVSSVLVDPTGKFAFVMSAANATSSSLTLTVYLIDSTTGQLTSIGAGLGLRVFGILHLTTDPSGRYLYAANSQSGNVSAYSINASNGGLTSIGTLLPAGVSPSAISIDPSGRYVYVANYGSNDVSAYKVNTGTGELDSVGAAVLAGTNPQAINVDPSGKFVYVANYTSRDVTAYNIHDLTGALTPLANTANVATRLGPMSMAMTKGTAPLVFTPKYAYVANQVSGDVSAFSINASTGALTSLGAVIGAGTEPYFITTDPRGRFVYVANSRSGNVSAYKITVGTGVLTAAGAPISSGNSPWSMVVDPSGRFLYVCNAGTGSQNIVTFAIDASTGALSLVGEPIAAGNSPYSITVDPTGQLLYAAVANSGNVLAFAINPNTGALIALGPVATGNIPRFVLAHPAGNFVYVTASSLTPYAVNYATGVLMAVGTPVPGGDFSSGTVADPTGRYLYQFSGGISAYKINPLSGDLTAIASGVSGSLNHTTVEQSGRFAYSVGPGGVTTLSINPSSGALTAVGSVEPAGNLPKSIVTTGSWQ